MRVKDRVVGWGWGKEKTFHRENEFLEHHEWLGTHDPSAFLTVPAAIAWQREQMSQEVRQQARDLVRTAVESAAQIDGIERVHADPFFCQMGLIDLTALQIEPDALKSRLYDTYKIEAPVIRWHDRTFVRISAHAYTTEQHIESLIDALREIAG